MSRIADYFSLIDEEVKKAYEIASNAKKKGYDPNDFVEIPLAKNISERVEGLISISAPQILGSGIAERITELEKIYGKLDWRVALQIAYEVAQSKFCSFRNQKEAIETGIRIGFSYLTLGVVSAPLEGFIGIDIKKRRDGENYVCLNYAGPIRAGGATAAAVSILIGDYVRKKLGYKDYDPDEQEINRFYLEIKEYHERCVRLQYCPSKEEVEFLIKNIGIEISGDPSEAHEVSNYKDLPRIKTNVIRGGMCLTLGECLIQKSPKVYKRIGDWGKEFGMEQWLFLKDFLDLQKKIKAKAGLKKNKKEKKKESNKNKNENIREIKPKEIQITEEILKKELDQKKYKFKIKKLPENEFVKKYKEKVLPNYKFIQDIIAGRPIFTFPVRRGGFRLRYGRCRTSGFASNSISHITLKILDDFIAVGTQLKIERPGKATVITACDEIEPPIVKLKNGAVKKLRTEEDVKKYKDEIDEILHLGDLLIAYGEFSENNHTLMPNGYVEEEWAIELVEKINNK